MGAFGFLPVKYMLLYIGGCGWDGVEWELRSNSGDGVWYYIPGLALQFCISVPGVEGSCELYWWAAIPHNL